MKLLKVFWLLALLSLAVARKLIFIECVTRHGIRYPAYPNNQDYSNLTAISNSQGELAPVGRQMLFLLGRQIYRKYWAALFKGTTYQKHYDRSLIYAKSTNRNRTIQSLQNLLAGLFVELQSKNQTGQLAPQQPPFPGDYQQIQNDIHFEQWKKLHLAPIHVQKGAQGEPWVAYMQNEGDFLVKEEPGLCPNQKRWQQENINSQFVRSLMKQPKIIKTIDRLRQFYPTLPLTFQHIYEYVDNYKCLKAMNELYLEVFENPEIKDYLEFLYIARLYVIYLHTETQRKAFSKMLLSTTISNMKEAISRRGPKMVFYSGHDITIAFLLSALNFTNLECLYQKYMMNQTVEHCYWQYPAFGSSFIFELYQEQNFEYSIEISINGEKQPIPVCNYSIACSLKDFQSWFQTYTLKESPNQACGVKVRQENLPTTNLLLAFALGMAAAYMLSRLTEKGNEQQAGERVNQDELNW